MTTFEKTRYAVGDKLELLSKGSKPPARSLTAVNAWTLANIATRLGQTGVYSSKEEQEERSKEADMVRPSLQYGALVNLDARPDPELLDEARRNQIRASRAIRDVSVYDEQSLSSALTSISVFLDRPQPTRPDVKLTENTPGPSTQKATTEKITSNLKVLQDGTGSDWTSVDSGPSLATTTATISGLSHRSRLRERIDFNLQKKGKLSSIPDLEVSKEQDFRSEASSDELPASTVVPDNVTEVLNREVADDLDDYFDQEDQTTRKRPKNLLLGKCAGLYILKKLKFDRIVNIIDFKIKIFRHIFPEFC